ncbi:unnamed protein product, partial [Polarella glacialis]
MEASERSTPAVILRSRAGGGIYSLSFASSGLLFSGGVEGEITAWDLDDRRPAASWAAASFTVLSVQGMARGASCLSQSKDGLLQLWDVATQKLCWEVVTDSCSFARCLALPTAGGDPLDADPSSCLTLP